MQEELQRHNSSHISCPRRHTQRGVALYNIRRSSSPCLRPHRLGALRQYEEQQLAALITYVLMLAKRTGSFASSSDDDQFIRSERSVSSERALGSGFEA